MDEIENDSKLANINTTKHVTHIRRLRLNSQFLLHKNRTCALPLSSMSGAVIACDLIESIYNFNELNY